MQPVPMESQFDTLAAHRAAIADLIEGAVRSLAIFDPDCAGLDLDSRAGVARLGAFLRRATGPSLRVVLHDFRWLETEAARLMTLLRDYGHVAAVSRTPESLRHLSEPFVLADGMHLVARFHFAHSRGKVLRYHPGEVEGWQRRFDELWPLCNEPLALSRLGL